MSCIPGVSRACGVIETVDAGADGCGGDDRGADHGAICVDIGHASYYTREMMRMQATRGTDNDSHSRMSDAILLTRAGANSTRGAICQGARRDVLTCACERVFTMTRERANVRSRTGATVDRTRE